jgi:hypothetical protein
LSALRIVFASIALTGLALASAAPANAAARSLAPTDEMYSISCDDTPPGQLFSVDASTGASEAIGIGDADTTCAGQPAWDATTDTAYYILFDFPTNSLATIDLSTGLTTTVGLFTDSTVTPSVVPTIQALAIGPDGAAYGFSETNFYAVDLGTASVTPLGTVANDILAFTVDPTTGLFYAADGETDIYSVNVTNGAVTLLDTLTLSTESTIFSMQVDSAGTFWYSTYDDLEDVTQLWSSTVEFAGTEELSGTFIAGGIEVFNEALLVTPGTVPVVPADPTKPALADTGVSTASAPLIGAGALGALLLGVVLVLRRRAATK